MENIYSLNNIDIKNLQYYVLPGNHNYLKNHYNIYDQAYSFWKKFWLDIYTQAGTPESFLPDDFYRQNYLGVLFHKSTFVGSLFSSVFLINSPSTVDHRYFKFYPKEFLEMLKQKNINTLFTVEFLTLNPDYRKSKIGISLSETIIGLSLETFKSNFYDSVIGTARTDVKVNDSCYKFGFECLVPKVERRNFSVDLIAANQKNLSKHPDTNIKKLIDTLWNNRIDSTSEQLAQRVA